ncbi:DUF2730 family protein [Rhizobium sullae]|uniref:DUF2730 family protein n=1 Tax=Rhizobium sullae TaxID=50338 RepID=A0ABY5XFM7_RHISU|nr:DUF2730 family protein [Rhizobium sullae]UWU13258.1 DUF2730 family protein [Rhizobium sullae]
MELETLKSWFGFFALLISVATSAWHIISSGSKKTASDLSEFKKQDKDEKSAILSVLQALEKRTQSLESDMKHLPDAKAVMELQIKIEQLSGQLGRMEENQKGMSRTVLQVQDFLMKGAVA